MSQESPVADAAVRQVPAPPAGRGLLTLSRVDYEDAFLARTDPAQDRTAEQWARAMLEDASPDMRRRLKWAWFALGLKHRCTRSDGFVLGWEVRRSTPDFALLGAGSRVGMPAELLFERRGDTLLVATFVQQQNVLARAMWAAIAARHRRVVPYLLRQAVSSDRAGRDAAVKRG